MIRIRMNEALATIDRCFMSGVEYDFADEVEAARLVRGGIAQLVDPKAKLPKIPEPKPNPANAAAPTPANVVLDRLPSTPVEEIAPPVETTPPGSLEETSGNPNEPKFAGFPLSHYARMTDEEILDVKGVGNALLKKIREAQKEAAGDDAADPSQSPETDDATSAD